MQCHGNAVRQLERHLATLERWAGELAAVLLGGGRLLTAGNGGSAAEAQHLSAELVGRYSRERRPLSALCLHAETSSLSALANDYGWEAAYARQVHAHGRRGDVLLALSTSGESTNLLAAVDAAAGLGLRTWALTGTPPNRLAQACSESVSISAAAPAVQEVHLLTVHLLCAGVDEAVLAAKTQESRG
ncbi:MAG: SIS domain-containing protein [Candidatus Dormibacteraeota bacterium]|uniref:SIS domain-containing protein n=1 Tax=Candidatus Dormiibacter inghamiae TaxID=3127013 RepID=A0A934KI43_9BACT|nr:SIS domain-containing protein [Candidatus Dormibacteraeota bacterium]MBJ7604750.1 SIS domain-containing protein [Candidatus Dormibacteraeota bacterium]